jgi:hypothetical protein
MLVRLLADVEAGGAVCFVKDARSRNRVGRTAHQHRTCSMHLLDVGMLEHCPPDAKQTA